MRELSLNVLDIAQNSIAARASLVTLTAEEDAEADRLTLRVEDNGCGMTPEQVEKVSDPFYTTRTTRPVGMGIPLFRMAAEAAGGGLTIASELGKGTAVAATFGLSHIDRLPLGDLCGTVSALIRLNPDIDFVFRASGERAGIHPRHPRAAGDPRGRPAGRARCDRVDRRLSAGTGRRFRGDGLRAVPLTPLYILEVFTDENTGRTAGHP